MIISISHNVPEYIKNKKNSTYASNSHTQVQKIKLFRNLFNWEEKPSTFFSCGGAIYCYQ